MTNAALETGTRFMSLSGLKTIHDWNRRRETLKGTLSPEQIAQIDGSGLVVKLLGVDKHQPHVSHYTEG